jgi:MarR family 2-MHQ and catechol resistance regulon transcriptional repressor
MKKAVSYGKEEDKALRVWIELARAFSAIRSRESAYIESHELTIQQFGVLEALYHLGSLSVGEITKVILSTPGNMTVVIKNLLSKELISKKAADNDKRKTLIEITDKGKTLIAEIFPKHADNIKSYFSCLTEEEKDGMILNLRKVSKRNKKHTA